ncbi:carbohydrate kinase family protein [Streptomyces galbus]|uniref:Carbohydrate kinase family protein n=1 Tax=Streptomyces galbus TaxID=33898 RepID=A0ABX1IDT4_STRGB|nr:carbohydrate kinase family protein [Streptomyces galbus]NKQ23659.1 carbohydrate kinase family protein [Streptomyces galbus]
MRIAVTGSIATDHLAVFPGRFTDQLMPDRLDHVSLSFLADTLEIRRGGVGANVAVGLARLGLTPLLVGAVGRDFAEYAAWLSATGVDTALYVSETRHTARFMCTTDADHNQIATFYAGAMTEARTIALEDVLGRAGTPDLVLVAPDDPEAMLRHTRACRALGVAFAADPSQQLARLDREQTRALITGARYLFTNQYESALLLERTGWTQGEVLDAVGLWVSTRGADGVVLLRRDAPPARIPALPAGQPADPTGVGDALRAGFLAGTAGGLAPEPAAHLGCALATLVLESVGTQDYKVVPGELLDRIGQAYGTATAAALAPLLQEAP